MLLEGFVGTGLLRVIGGCFRQIRTELKNETLEGCVGESG